MERIEPQSDNDKSYLQFKKEKKVKFEDDMPDMKTEMNHNLLTQNQGHLFFLGLVGIIQSRR